MPIVGNYFERRIPKLLRRTLFVLGVLASTALTPVASAGRFPTVIKLSSLDGTNGFRLDGVRHEGKTGVSVTSAGDVN